MAREDANDSFPSTQEAASQPQLLIADRACDEGRDLRQLLQRLMSSSAESDHRDHGAGLLSEVRVVMELKKVLKQSP